MCFEAILGMCWKSNLMCCGCVGILGRNVARAFLHSDEIFACVGVFFWRMPIGGLGKAGIVDGEN